jgi:hypothetical protein
MKTEFVCARDVKVARTAFGCLLGPAASLHSYGMTASAAGGELGRSRMQSRCVPPEAPA